MLDLSLLVQGAAYLAGTWSVFIFLVQCIGNTRIFTKYASRSRPAVSSNLPSADVPHITIIRPVKGLETELYQCIASTFRLDYPRDKLTIHLCVADKSDPAYAVLVQLVRDFPGFDARVLVEKEDPLLHGSDGHVNNLGPNPKIRNISRGYREAKGDLVWIIDCNIWVGRGVAGRMADKLLGLQHDGSRATPYKFVHLLPLVVDIMGLWDRTSESQALLSASSETGTSSDPAKVKRDQSLLPQIQQYGGGRLDEMFMATTHAKFYSAINTVGVAPCVVGKSNMFRKSHLDMLTDPTRNPDLPTDKSHPTGIDYFSDYICEDHLIGDLLWRSKLPGLRNHGLVFGDIAIQPMADMSVQAYIARRVRWLRARKWTVIAATIVEPGVESLLCCSYSSFAITTIPWFNQTFGIPQTWSAMGVAWLASVTLWMIGDWLAYNKLHAGKTVEVDENTPRFARGTGSSGGTPRRPFHEWLPTWIGRELLALPIWTWAVLLGTTVVWRGRTFNVRMDMSVEEVGDESTSTHGSSTGVNAQTDNARSRSKNRLD
ncbi:hypothetical protein D7B24_006727 [Verticillium nonalfalfae]|uniref:Ceramide glucosyltransferase n=1 Tax=Verticillium nonalfalfae TaxID=1051616 RepID=A0A3M9YJQ2_9PEZI|nr:uncharacterized protein D7B24_006727 [Verticillium nonalfalfae]RNJ60659.1 hypothetical protein D7B24_006727 [Verticillium nonalfalfae]